MPQTIVHFALTFHRAFCMIRRMDKLIIRFQQVRTAAGMSFADVGRELGVAPTTVGRWEQNGTVRSGSARQVIQAFIDRHSGSAAPSRGSASGSDVSSVTEPGGVGAPATGSFREAV